MHEGRKFPRIYFTTEDRVYVLLETESREQIRARVLNLSEGGLGLGLKPEVREMIEKDDMVRIVKMDGLEDIELVRPLKAKIMWVFAHEGFHHVGAGCMFIGAGEVERELFRRVVNSRR